MGNGNSSFTQLEVDRDRGGVYEDWTMAPGELGDVPVTVFSAAHPPSSRKRPYIERALQASRVYRHPGLLKYIDGGIIGEVVVITERAKPLLHHDLDQMSPLHISAGLLSIIDTLVFLHDRAGVSHNNVSAASIFITSDGTWKLWGLEYSCSFGELTRDHIEHINGYCHEKSIPPDDKARITPAYQHARDSYAFACFVEEILTSDRVAVTPPDIAGAEEFVSWLRSSGKNKDWAQRPRLSLLANHQIFHHDFLKLHHNLTNVLLLSDHNREEFVKSLADSLCKYPEELVSSTLAGALLSRPLLLHPAAATHLMPKLLIPQSSSEKEGESGLFSPEVFRRDIIPQVVRLYSVHDATVRNILLTFLPHYVSLIPEDVLANDVLPELLLGIRDSSDTLVTATLHALAHLVPILGANRVIGENRQHLFTTAKPKAAASLPVAKGMVPHQLKNSEGTTKNANVKPWTTSSKRTKSSEPPVPPPRSISLTPESVSQDPKLEEAASLDSLSVESMVLTQIPERSSPDGGEDHSSSTNTYVGASEMGVTDTDAWSDWEEMQDSPAQDFSGALLAVNQDKLKGFDDWGNGEDDGTSDGDLLKENTLTSVAPSKKTWSDHTSSHEVRYGDTSPYPKSSSSMKLNSVAQKNSEKPIELKRSQNLGEEYDILAIKVNKKHDAEMDLFADIAPQFNTKKYDLETMLLEATSKSQGNPKIRTLSVSETLAGTDSSADVGEAWGEEGAWGDQIDLLLESATSSPLKETQEESDRLASFTYSDLPEKVDLAFGKAASQSKKQEANGGLADTWDEGWGSDF
ncbi:protein-associating with the carboxyl-terminal domain of ezrin-like isoform X1 [Penaeus chinensis]|uniref:protein-associating with the carboxyl-terminal domain of ezrin-like isoform X1 n=1 Tax=Penaeus chinensis TaxID=139456 RepID=UPI001FB742E7|nr:protein-associating with the carboxyl-terminal domain of ezrin-like isoform X1 [Penaeus chinensis]